MRIGRSTIEVATSPVIEDILSKLIPTDRCVYFLKVGKVDMLINNAGTVFGETLLELSDVAIETTYKVNILSHYWVSCH